VQCRRMHAVVSSPVRTASSICEPRASSEMLTCCGGIASALRSIEHATIRRPINLRCLVAQRWFGRLGLELSPSAVLPYDWTLPWQTRVQRHKQAFNTPRPDTCFTLPSFHGLMPGLMPGLPVSWSRYHAMSEKSHGTCRTALLGLTKISHPSESR
jgi:hypothetical protein